MEASGDAAPVGERKWDIDVREARRSGREVERARRLRKSSEFGEVFRKGRVWSDRLLVLRALPNGLDRTRLGFAVNRRLGTAVVRNRIKRRLREAARRVPMRFGADVVVIARGPAGAASLNELQAALAELVMRAKLLAEPTWNDEKP